MNEFITKHQKDILGVLSGFDRVRFRGTFRVLAVARLLMSWLDDLVRRACPALLELPGFGGQRQQDSWSADETEWATDVLFRSENKLAALSPSLIHHALNTFASRDVMPSRSPRTRGLSRLKPPSTARRRWEKSRTSSRNR